ncbi:MAG: hypothetical protein RIS94_1999 [Pseudomonadota bacterium]|jgi:DNA-binding NtrC family response regulator
MQEDRTDIAPASGARILLVDDEEDILPEYQEYLAMEGLPSLTSSNPEEAYAVVLADPDISVLVTDMRMAPLNGAELIRKLRQALPGRALTYIVLTGFAAEWLGGEDLNATILTKPVDLNLLVDTLRAALVWTA